MSDAAIQIESVSLDYSAQGSAPRRILNEINLRIKSGEFVSIVGQTGCGKSSLLRLVLGEESPSRGRVLVDGSQRSKPDPLCGYVPQKYSLFPDKTVLDNVTFGLDTSAFGAFPWLHPARHRQFPQPDLRRRVRGRRALILGADAPLSIAANAAATRDAR